MLGDIYLPKEIECEIVSNFIYADDIESFIQDDNNNLRLAQHCIRKVISGRDRRYNDVSPRLINKLSNVEEVDGIIQLETLSETYLLATHPSLHTARFSLLFGDNTIFMIYQFLLTLNKPLPEVRYLFYLSDSHEDDYLYIHKNTLFIKYTKNIEVNLLCNLLVHLLMLNIYENIYLFMNWSKINEENTENIVELLNEINKPINILYPLNNEEIYIDNNSNMLQLLHNINIIPDVETNIDFTIIFPVSSPSKNRIITGPFNVEVIRDINDDIENLQDLHTIGIKPYNIDINTLNDIAELLPTSIKTIYIFTDDINLINNNPKILKDRYLIFTFPQYIPLNSSYIYRKF